MSKGPESAVKEAIKAYLTSIGAYWYMVVPTGYSRRGIPDFIACYKGRFIGIEAKAQGKTPTKWQDKEMDGIRAAGGIAILAEGDDAVDAVKRGLGLC